MQAHDWPSELGLSQETWDGLNTEEKLWCIWIENRDIFGVRVDDWPPTDQLDNPYPYEWIDPDELDRKGQLSDSNYNDFNPFAGNREPREGHYCNVPLANYEERYGERRYCARTVHVKDDYCPPHKNRSFNDDMHAKELLQHGVTTKSRDHFYNKLEPHERLLVHAIHEDLLGESTYEFAVQYQERYFDVDDLPMDVDDLPDEACREKNTFKSDGTITGTKTQLVVEVAYAEEHIKRSLALLAAATDTVKQLKIQPELLESGMLVESASYADHVVPTEDNTVDEPHWSTFEEENEHPLNLAYSRLVKDEKELLKIGGVPIEGEADSGGTNPLLDRLARVTDTGEGVTTADPELAQDGSEMARQIEAADGELDLETADDD